MKSLTSFFLVIILLAVKTPAQKTQDFQSQKMECGTVLTQEHINAEKTYLRQLSKQAIEPPVNLPYQIPLTIHIVRRSNGMDGFTLDQLEIALQDLNRMWKPTGIQFFQQGTVNYINSDYYFNIPDDDNGGQGVRDQLRLVNPIWNTINVYFTNLDGLCGESTFSTYAIQGVVMDIGCAGAINPSTLSHEVGHYFNLLHTHETKFGVECPSGNNCSVAGDSFCDTPADPGLRYVSGGIVISRVSAACAYNNSASLPNTCDSTPYNPPTFNLMSYSDPGCRDQFTKQQISKILNTLTVHRSYLINSGTRFVSATAPSDSNSCTYQAPCRKLSSAVLMASPSDSIFVAPGIYLETPTIAIAVFLRKWGSDTAPVTIGK